MSATSDMILERRRIRRRLAFWRIAAILALVLLAGVVLSGRSASTKGDQIARISISGLITHDHARDQMIRELASTDHVKAAIVQINSPGGTVAGSEGLFEAIRDLAEAKPTVAVMAEAAASGGYIAAIGTDHIVARGNTLTGSIGVVAEIPNVAGLLDMIGIDVNRVKSSPLKAEPGFTSAPSPEALAQQEQLILDTYEWFKDLVQGRRNLSDTELENVSDGRAFTGRQALQLGLIDQIGGEPEAKAHLVSERGIAEAAKIVDWSWEEEDVPWLFRYFDDAARSLSPSAGFLTSGPRLYAVIQ